MADTFIAHTTHLKPGDIAPGFIAKDQHGNVQDLAAYKGKTVILYFYPKDNTPTCTKQACNLRDEYTLLRNKNMVVLGVSADTEKSHIKFAQKYQLPFPLLADPDMRIIKAYDVWGTKMLFGRIYDSIVRTTFIIGSDGIIKDVINKVDAGNHAQQILGV